jgi:hypothetical protein
MTGAGGGGGNRIKVERGCHMAASLTLSQITSVDLVSPQSKAVCTENLIRVADVMESPKLAE